MIFQPQMANPMLQMMSQIMQQSGMGMGQPIQLPRPESNLSAANAIKVSNESEPQVVAGALAHASRVGECPSIHVIGPRAVNQAVKAIAIARNYLADERIDLAAEPWYREEENDFIQISMRKVSALRTSLAETSAIKVAGASVPAKVAGSIANGIRQGERIAVTAMGAGSVHQAVAAIILARRYLKNDGMGLHFRSSFTTSPSETGAEMSLVKFNLYASQV